MMDQKEIIDFIDETLRDMTLRPAFWGPLPSVELQVLRLLEVRLLLSSPDASVDDVPDVANEYWSSLDADFPGAAGSSLRARVKGDPERFAAWLSGFCARQRSAQDQRSTPVRVTPLRAVAPPSAPQLRHWSVSHEYSSDRPVVRGAPTLPRQ